MDVRLIRYTTAPDELCGYAAAECYQGKSYERSLDRALENGHHSTIEHASFTFAVEGVSRVLLAQLTRHRHASFSVQSQRYCGADLDVVIPQSMADLDLLDEIVEVRCAVRKLYEKAKKLKKPDEDIRYFTLQAGKTRLVMTMNARELHHFFSLRCCNRAQWEIREMAWEMLKLCKEAAPQIFEHAGPPCVYGRCTEGRMSCGKPYTEGENA